MRSPTCYHSGMAQQCKSVVPFLAFPLVFLRAYITGLQPQFSFTSYGWEVAMALSLASDY